VRAAAYVILGVWAILWVGPIAVMAVASLKPDDLVLTEAGTWRALVPTEASFDNYRDVFDRVAFGRILLNSVLINGVIVCGGLIVNSAAGYALARLRWRGRRIALGFVLALLLVPLEAIAVPLFYGTTLLGWRDTYLVQIVPFVANALTIYLFYAFFVDFPLEVEEAAKTDGAGPWRVFFRIVVPQSKPVFASVAVVTFLLYWGLYLWPLLVTSRTEVRPLPLGIASFSTLPPIQWGDIMAFAVMMVAPVVLAFLVLQRWFIRGVARTGVKG
jgi:multiple sugar transport system permease protein